MAPFLGYVSNILQVHQFGNALLFRKQRNMPVGAQDIGSFQGCFEIVASLAVVTNCALIFFTMHEALFPNVELFYLVWIFFGTQALIWGIMGIVKYSISDVPKEVEMQLLRQDFIRREAFHDDLFDEPPGARSLKKKKHTVSGTAAAVIAVLPHPSMEDCQLGGAEVPSEESQGGEISPLISSRHAEEELC